MQWNELLIFYGAETDFCVKCLSHGPHLCSSSTSNLSHPPSTSHCTTELAAHLIWSSQEIAAAGRKSTNSSSNSSSSAVGVGDDWARFQASQRRGPRQAISRHTPLRTPVKTTSNLSYTFDPGPQVKVPAFWMASWGMDSSNQSGSVWEFKKWLQRLLTSNYSMSSNTFWKCSLKGVKLKAAFAVEMSSWILFWMFLCPDWSTEKFKKNSALRSHVYAAQIFFAIQDSIRSNNYYNSYYYAQC